MLVLAIAIAAAWAVMLGSAYLGRVVLRLGKVKASGLVAGSYLLCAALALTWFGFGASGLLGITGLLLPGAVALLFARS